MSFVRKRQRQIYPHSIQPQFTTQRRIGSVTVDNLNNGRYQGEMQMRQTLSAHDNVNVVAQIIKEDLPLLSCGRSQKLGKKMKI